MKYTYVESLEHQLEQYYKDLNTAKGVEADRINYNIFEARDKYHALTGRNYERGFSFQSQRGQLGDTVGRQIIASITKNTTSSLASVAMNPDYAGMSGSNQKHIPSDNIQLQGERT